MAGRARRAVARVLRWLADELDPPRVDVGDGLALFLARLRTRRALLIAVGERLPAELREAGAAEAGAAALDVALVAVHAAGVAADAAAVVERVVQER